MGDWRVVSEDSSASRSLVRVGVCTCSTSNNGEGGGREGKGGGRREEEENRRGREGEGEEKRGLASFPNCIACKEKKPGKSLAASINHLPNHLCNQHKPTSSSSPLTGGCSQVQGSKAVCHSGTRSPSR